MSDIQIQMNSAPLAREERVAVNRTGSQISRGNVVALDLASTASETSTLANFSNLDDQETHPYAAVVNVDTNNLSGGIFLVALETIDDDAIGRFAIQGEVDAEVDSNVAVEDRLTGVNGSTNLTDLTDGAVSLGIAMESGPGSGTANAKVLFNGRALGAAGSAT